MLVIAIASQKGGSGKTTLSGHLAVEAERAGAGPVTLIDTDPQGSLSQWWNARAARTPQFAKVGAFELQAALNELGRSGTQLAIIDTPPSISESILHVIAHADLVIVPARPSPHDLRAVGATIDMAERFGKPVIFVINGGTPRARINGEAAVALSQHGTVAPVFIHHRVDFAASMVDGRTVGEAVPKSVAAKEISDLWTYVRERAALVTNGAALTTEERNADFAVAADTPISSETAELSSTP
ncbi:MAG TPA: ParA family protein [Micropepsaceae bacterium]|jgi:chromosome partitioning protein|nr:ParA family protein [Micropepsaceae bacterium]